MPSYIIWILFGLAAISFVIVAFIVFRHWSEIRLLDPNSIKEEKERKQRDTLVQERFKRIQQSKIAPIKSVYQQGIFKAKTAFHRAYLNLIKVNKFYEQAKHPFAKVAPTQDERIKILLDEARSLARDLKWAEAEKRYLEILLMDNRNVDAYKGIGLIYLKQKMLEQAKETFEYLIKVKAADDIVYASLADIAELENNPTAEEAMRLKAIEVRPRLANRHAELAALYAEQEDYQKAWPAAKRATDLDPKSVKYQEIALECVIHLDDWMDAKRRYDKLRLICDDQPKLQKFRERIDAMREKPAETSESEKH